MAEFHDYDDEEESTLIGEWVLDSSDFVSKEAADKYFQENPDAPRVAYEVEGETISVFQLKWIVPQSPPQQALNIR